MIDEGYLDDDAPDELTEDALDLEAAITATADVFIQAGHEGRTTGATGAEGPLGREIDWTPVVANEATRILRQAGVSVIRAKASLSGRYRCKVAVFMHFDGSENGSSKASVGYNDPTDKPAASAWKALYGRYWPFGFMGDNFTANLRGYYGFAFTQTTDAEFVIEFGDLNARDQAEWLKPRLPWLGALVAHFLSKRIGKDNVPDPGPFVAPEIANREIANSDSANFENRRAEAFAVAAPAAYSSGAISENENLSLNVPFLASAPTTVAEMAISPLTLEAIVEEVNFLPAWFLEVGTGRAAAVCKIKTSGVSYDGRSGAWSGTGFLVSPNILLTNHHVLNSVEVARNGRALFNYQTGPDGRLLTETVYRLNPERLFITSPIQNALSQEALDFTFVWVDGKPGDTFGFVPLDRSARVVNERDYANIIQHPNGDPKVVVVQENQVVNQNLLAVRYNSDTLPGSSGSCVMSNEWSPIALHHASRSADDGSGRIENEGIKFSAIAAFLENLAHGGGTNGGNGNGNGNGGGGEATMAREVLALFGGTDELMGFFGALGRETAHPETGVEVVVNRYRGESDDLDVGFWNVEWLVNRFEDKLDEVAQVIVAMNLDIWSLEETGAEATQALVDHLNSKYHMDFDCAFSEPNSGRGKQATALMWNRKTVRGEKRAWPNEIEAWLQLSSRDFGDGSFLESAEGQDAFPTGFSDLQLEVVEGKIFDRYPALYYFRSASREDSFKEEFDFFLVPLHLKAMDEGSKRRRLASRILAAAVRRMIEAGEDGDWILGGDVNATLASGDFADLVAGGSHNAAAPHLTPLAAKDEEDGAFSYVKGPRSLIDHIFLSPNLAKDYDAGDYFIVAADKEFPDYIKKISDHRPVLIRLSLKDRVEAKLIAMPTDAETREVLPNGLSPAASSLLDALRRYGR